MRGGLTIEQYRARLSASGVKVEARHCKETGLLARGISGEITRNRLCGLVFNTISASGL